MSEPINDGETRQVPLHLIDDPELASRAEIADEPLERLADSIRVNGLINPITLSEFGERYRVVAGHRRTLAARLAGLVSISARVLPDNHPRLLEIQVEENARRVDLNPIDEALWFAELLERACGNDVRVLAARVNESHKYVLDRLELLELDEETREALRAEKIKIGVARALLKCPDLHYRRYYLDHSIRGGATVGMVENWIQDWKNTHGAAIVSAPAEPLPSVVIPGPRYDPLRCHICGQNDPRYLPESINVHTHCLHAILEPMLKAYRGE